MGLPRTSPHFPFAEPVQQTIYETRITNERQARRALTLMEYSETIRSLPGSENVVADALSRPSGVIKDPLPAGKVITVSFPEVAELSLHTGRMITAADYPTTYVLKIQTRGNDLESYLCRRLNRRIQVSVGDTDCSMHDCHTWRGHACAEYAERTGALCTYSQN